MFVTKKKHGTVRKPVEMSPATIKKHEKLAAAREEINHKLMAARAKVAELEAALSKLEA